jgi:uncharacterized protein YjbI with pentapeptide repeats
MLKWGDRSEPSVMPTGVSVAAQSEGSEAHRQWVEARWQFEDDRWSRIELQEAFAATIDRVGNATNPVFRIVAAERLVELAQKRIPGGSIQTNTDGYPFYLPAVQGLCATLVLEELPEVRVGILNALTLLLEFGRQGEQLLLYAALQPIAEVNRTTLRLFRETLGRYVAKYGVEDVCLPPLVGFIPFTESGEVTLKCLYNIASDPECLKVREKMNALRMAQAKFGEPSTGPNNTLLENLAKQGQNLVEARELLANALREIHAPPFEVESSTQEFSQWRNTHRLFLMGVFLAGAKLSGVALPGAILTRAHLEGVNAEGANLIGAELIGAYLSGAELYGVFFEGSTLPDANLRDADWWNATPTSWRGHAGEMLQRWLSTRHPEAAPVLRLTETASEGSAESETNEAPTPEAPVRTVGGAQTAAEKIAELKRKANDKTASEARSDPRRKENTVAVARDKGSGVLGVAPARVVMRDKGLPDENAEFSENDLNQIVDLMSDAPRGDGVSVRQRANDMPSDSDLTDDDLLDVQDLMKG